MLHMIKLKKTSTPPLERSEIEKTIALTEVDIQAIRQEQYAARMQRLLEVQAILERELSRESD